MLKIRLQRVGRKHDPAFRVVLVDSHSAAKSGKAIELLGSYHQRDDKPTLKDDRIKHWINTGAQLSPTVHNMLISAGIIEGKKINVLPQKRPAVKEQPTHSTPSTSSGQEGSGQATDNPQPTTDDKQPPTETEQASEAPHQPVQGEASEATEDAPAEKADDSAAEDTEGKDDEEEKPAEDTPSEAPHQPVQGEAPETSQEEPESSENGELKKS